MKNLKSTVSETIDEHLIKKQNNIDRPCKWSPINIIKSIISFFAVGLDKPLIQGQNEIDRLYKKYRISILLTTSIGYAFYYTCRLGLSVAREPLVSNGILTIEQTGTIGAATFITYAIGKLTNGFIVDHGNIRRLFSMGLMASAILNLIMGSTSVFWIFIFVWGLNGWFQAFGAPSSGVALVNWYSNHERGRFYSVWNASMPGGEAVTFVVTASLVSYLGWRAGFIIPGFTCIVVSILIYVFMRDRPIKMGLPAIQDWKKDHGVEVIKVEGDKPVTTWTLQKESLKLPRLWIIMIAASCLYVTRYAISGYGMFYLQEARGLSISAAGAVLGIGTFAAILGGFAYGFISDTVFKARRPPLTAIFGVVEIVTLLLIFYYPTTNISLLTFLFIVHGFIYGGMLLGVLILPMDILPKRVIGAVSGIVGIGSYLAAAATEHISGYLIGKGSHVIDGIKSYDFTYAIMFWIGAMILCLLLQSLLWNVKMSD